MMTKDILSNLVGVLFGVLELESVVSLLETGIVQQDLVLRNRRLRLLHQTFCTGPEHYKEKHIG